MARAMNLGMPRIGPRRELKRAVESYWTARSSQADLARTAASCREENWRRQAAAGIESIPSNDFTLYDHVLDACCMVGAIPPRFGAQEGPLSLDTYFAMARGAGEGEEAVQPLEMTKWFDTNYHYLVPELGPTTAWRLDASKAVEEFREARELGIETRPVLLGPVSFLLLSKATVPGFQPLELLDGLTDIYRQAIETLAREGAEWVQLDEPWLVGDLSAQAGEAYRQAYSTLRASAAKLMVATYFGGLGDNLALATSLGVEGIHVDLVSDPDQLGPLLEALPEEMTLSAGVVDGRNIWRNDLRRTFGALREAGEVLGERLWVAPSCSLLHVPLDLSSERRLDPELVSWLCFGYQKLDEVAWLARALDHPEGDLQSELARSDETALKRAASPRVHRPEVAGRLAGVSDSDAVRSAPLARRQEDQRRRLQLPLLPTTTIGSFPQTAQIRRLRSRWAAGEISEAGYQSQCRDEIERVIRQQEEIGLDVLVHGEVERNDMVQYFAEQLTGFAATEQGWVQSYGTRCIRPPILFGDVSRPGPITLDWWRHAQSLTTSPVKGMLTGPVTMLKWSFVRDDRPASLVCTQIALALRDEVQDLEAAGAKVIQVDEPALREGLPLRRAARATYLDWATRCFRLTTAGVADATQIHTHMCYGEFSDILEAIAAMDPDVISMEAARSGMDLLDPLSGLQWGAGVGPGVYDIHSPLVPSRAQISALIEQALSIVGPDRLWVNPDCGLKTRGEEVSAALTNLVAAARSARQRLAGGR